MPSLNQPIGRTAQAALLTWVNTFALDRRIDRLEDLADGHVFAQMLHDLDPEYDPADVLAPAAAGASAAAAASTWLANKRNIQAVFKALTRYCIHTDTSGTIDYLPRTVDARAIADNPNAEGLAQLVALFAAAAMLGGHNTRYIPVMRKSLTTGEQAEIMAILQRKDEARQRLAADAASRDASMGAAEGPLVDDPALVAEAQLATLAADYDRLAKRLADTNTRLEHLQISYEQIKDDLERKERALELAQQTVHVGASESQLVRGLQAKLREQDELITSQEAQAEDDRQAKQRLAAENAQLARRATLVEPLQDQVQELKHANDELSKKANTVDRYKQKLEAQRGLEKDLQNALYELGQHRDALRELEALQTRAVQQAATIERFRAMVSALEQQMEEHRIQKAALENDLYAAHVQLESRKEQAQLGEARMVELEQQLLLHGGGGSGSGGGTSPAIGAAMAGAALDTPGTPSGAAKPAFSLEEELQNTAGDASPPIATTTRTAAELARLRAENALLRSSVAGGSETERLRADLEAARAKEALARAKYTSLFEKHTLLEAQMQAVETGGGSGGGEGGEAAPLLETQRVLRATTAALEQRTAEARALADQAADRQREVLRVRVRVGEMGAEAGTGTGTDTDATDSNEAERLIAASLQTELESLRRDFRALQLENEQQQRQLIEALVSKEELRKTMAATAAAAAAAATAEDQPSAAGGSGSGNVDEQLRHAQEKNEKLRAAVKLLKRQCDTADETQAELRRKLQAATADPTAAATQLRRNLERETTLMTTAWYDLTTRLQSNHVVLQRGRPEAPRSWLSRQRQLVNGTPRR